MLCGRSRRKSRTSCALRRGTTRPFRDRWRSPPRGGSARRGREHDAQLKELVFPQDVQEIEKRSRSGNFRACGTRLGQHPMTEDLVGFVGGIARSARSERGTQHARVATAELQCAWLVPTTRLHPCV